MAHERVSVDTVCAKFKHGGFAFFFSSNTARQERGCRHENSHTVQTGCFACWLLPISGMIWASVISETRATFDGLDVCLYIRLVLLVITDVQIWKIDVRSIVGELKI